MPLLMGKTKAVVPGSRHEDSVLVRFAEEAFWTLMSCCPSVRKVVLANMSQRMQMYQVEALHREKLVSLGTLAAGLMHELHNPGSAAKRAASQLRENLMRLQQLSLRISDRPKTHEQLDCMRGLLEHTLRGCHCQGIEQRGAGGCGRSHVGVAGRRPASRMHTRSGRRWWRWASTSRNWRARGSTSKPAAFSDALNWLEALVSSVSQVCAIEESISRISRTGARR